MIQPRKKNPKCVGKSKTFIHLAEQNQLSLAADKVRIQLIRKVCCIDKSPCNWNSSKHIIQK